MVIRVNIVFFYFYFFSSLWRSKKNTSTFWMKTVLDLEV